MKKHPGRQKVLFSSVCKPIGPSVGDGDSVGYELLHGQVTRSQHIYSPRVIHKQFSLDFIATNIDTPSTVLHYPSRNSFIKELKKGYDVVGIAFVLSTHHHAIEMCKLVRQYSPQSKIVLGGYGTVMNEAELSPYCDAICKGEGVRFMREFLGEPPRALTNYRHPEISSRLRIFGIPVSHTAMIFGGLGCPNGCDFCCTSHFFNKEHVPLLPSGESIFDFMYQQKQKHKDIEYTIIDEDFLLNKERAYGFLKKCREKNVSFSTFCFASVKALSQYSVEEILEMGIDGIWIGYEGKKSGYSKHQGQDIDLLIKRLIDNGITVLASMILGIPYQDEAIVRKEFAQLIADRPTLTQYLIYGPTPGTPFYQEVVRNDQLVEVFKNDRVRYYKSCTGFYSMVKHPFMPNSRIEELQKEFYRKDFELLGPSILRVAESKINGYHRYKNHSSPLLQQKALEFRNKATKFLCILPVAIIGPQISFKNRLYYMQLLFKIMRISKCYQWGYLLLAPLMTLAALATWIKLTFNLFEHPFTRVYHYQVQANRSKRRHGSKYKYGRVILNDIKPRDYVRNDV
ncbi:MAG: cobalamin-dependent protein [Oligoflexia bacterium]|nr:cobalamin-dependent protein [Oligoflexia bacterium]